MNNSPVKKSKTTRYLTLTVLMLIFSFIAGRLYFNLTDDFRIANITTPLPYNADLDIPSLTNQEQQKLFHILDQQFHYLGKGAQSYVFESDDGQYVIKFFKFKHLRPSFWLDILPPIGPLKSYKETQNARKVRKFQGVFTGYHLAYQKDKDLSGLVFVKLNVECPQTDQSASPSSTASCPRPFPTIIVTDKLGLHRSIDLNSVPFIIQYKGITLRNALKDQLIQKNVEEAKSLLHQIIDLYSEEYARGIFDHDHGVLQNAGFINGKAAHLDVGKFNENPSMKENTVAKADLLILHAKIDSWLETNFPQYHQEISQNLLDYIEKKFPQYK